jgi:hypothetical protein
VPLERHYDVLQGHSQMKPPVRAATSYRFDYFTGFDYIRLKWLCKQNL